MTFLIKELFNTDTEAEVMSAAVYDWEGLYYPAGAVLNLPLYVEGDGRIEIEKLELTEGECKLICEAGRHFEKLNLRLQPHL